MSRQAILSRQVRTDMFEDRKSQSAYLSGDPGRRRPPGAKEGSRKMGERLEHCSPYAVAISRPSADSSLREPDDPDGCPTGIGGQRLRIRFSNAYGSTPLEIGAAHVASHRSWLVDRAGSRSRPHLRWQAFGYDSDWSANLERSGRNVFGLSPKSRSAFICPIARPHRRPTFGRSMIPISPAR